MNYNDKVIQNQNILIILSMLIIISIWVSLVITIRITELTLDENFYRLTKISQQLEMCEEAKPPGEPVIYEYLSEDKEDCLNNDLSNIGC